MSEQKSILDTSGLALEHRLVIAEKEILIINTQLGRIISDIESEKATRARTSAAHTESLEALDKRLRVVEKSIWIAFGILAAIQVLLKF